MSLEVLALGLISGLRPGTSLAAVLALLRTRRPERPLVVFAAAGLASSLAVGLLVVELFHGANVAVGGSSLTAVIDVALGAAALGFGAGLQQGWVQPRRPGGNRASPAAARIAARLHDPSPAMAAAAGVVTHLPGLIYLVALNEIAAGEPRVPSAALQVVVYDLLWFMVPLAALALVVLRPGTALAYLELVTRWGRRHEHVLLVAGSLGLGGYLVAKGASSLLL
jgi:hypothetical protein